MSNSEQCGDYEIFFEDDWWVVKNTKEDIIVGKFVSKDDALEKVSSFLQSDEGRIETESVC